MFSLQVVKYVENRAAVFNDVLKLASSIKDTPEGKEALFLVTALISKFICFVNRNLQQNFMNILSLYSNKDAELKIIYNVIHGCITFARNNGNELFYLFISFNFNTHHFFAALQPIFAPSWNSQERFISAEQLPLGILQALISNNLDATTKQQENVIEFILYLIWHHVNIYFLIVESPDQIVLRFREESASVLNESIFTKTQTLSQVCLSPLFAFLSVICAYHFFLEKHVCGSLYSSPKEDCLFELLNLFVSFQ